MTNPKYQSKKAKFAAHMKAPEQKYIRLQNDIEIAYLDQGPENGEMIVFIHGLANASMVWQWNTLVLSETLRCISIDLPGNGLSSRGEYSYGMAFYQECVLAFLQALNIQKVTLAGHSMGGQIAIGCALTAPNLVKDLLLFAPAGFEYYTPEEAILFESAIRFGNFLNMDELHIAQSINASFFQTSADSKKIIDTLNEYIQKNNRNSYRRMLDLSISSMLKEQMFYDLQKITQPVLVFFGEDDMLIPNRFLHPISTSEIARKACNEIKQSFLFTYPQTGHFVQIERAVEVNHTIQQYFKGQNPGL